MALTKKKAVKILSDGRIRGRKITQRQRRFFGSVASGSLRRSPRTFGGAGRFRKIPKRRFGRRV